MAVMIYSSCRCMSENTFLLLNPDLPPGSLNHTMGISQNCRLLIHLAERPWDAKKLIRSWPFALAPSLHLIFCASDLVFPSFSVMLPLFHPFSLVLGTVEPISCDTREGTESSSTVPATFRQEVREIHLNHVRL